MANQKIGCWVINPIRLFLIFVLILFYAALNTPVTNAQTSAGLPCNERPTRVSIPTADPRLFCLERVITLNNAGELAFTGLAALSDGRLFTVSPIDGTLLELVDTDGDSLSDTPEVVAEGLVQPVALTAYQNSLYITGGPVIYRWTETDGIQTIVSDLPASSDSITRGYWNGGLVVGGEGENTRLYVGVGAICDFCEDAVVHTERGVIFSFTLDGTDRQLVATGFRQPSGMIWHQDSLWVTDTAPAAFETGRHDELNQVNIGDDISDYGAPFCGGQNEPLSGSANCENSIAPVLNLPSGSAPTTLAAYQGDAYPAYVGQFLIAFSGSAHASRMQGYTVELFSLDSETPSQLTLVPALPDRDQQYGGVGFYPHHLYGLVISPEGWIYFSVGGGSLYVIRPG
jgi:glucose/arabinose dehydrogenase